MKTIEECRRLVYNGAKFSVDLKARSLRVNGKCLIRNGEHELPLGKFRMESSSIDEVIREIERLYRQFKRSVPSERSEAHRRAYFKALPEKELTDEDMMYGEPREHARFELESFVLMAIMCGALTWQDGWGSWFWQSSADKDLVILRSWVEPESE